MTDRWWPPVPDDARPVVLTARQADVLDGLMRGYTNRRIARELGLTEDTIKSHAKDLFRALDARDRCHAAVLAISGAVDITVLARNGNEKKL